MSSACCWPSQSSFYPARWAIAPFCIGEFWQDPFCICLETLNPPTMFGNVLPAPTTTWHSLTCGLLLCELLWGDGVAGLTIRKSREISSFSRTRLSARMGSPISKSKWKMVRWRSSVLRRSVQWCWWKWRRQLKLSLARRLRMLWSLSQVSCECAIGVTITVTVVIVLLQSCGRLAISLLEFAVWRV